MTSCCIHRTKRTFSFGRRLVDKSITGSTERMVGILEKRNIELSTCLQIELSSLCWWNVNMYITESGLFSSMMGQRSISQLQYWTSVIKIASPSWLCLSISVIFCSLLAVPILGTFKLFINCKTSELDDYWQLFYPRNTLFLASKVCEAIVKRFTKELSISNIFKVFGTGWSWPLSARAVIQ